MKSSSSLNVSFIAIGLQLLLGGGFAVSPSRTFAGEKSACESLIETQPQIDRPMAIRASANRKFALYNGTEAVKDYTQILENLQLGDELDFGDGHVFVFKKKLNSRSYKRVFNEVSDDGETAWVLETQNGQALRLPRESSVGAQKMHLPRILHFTIDSFLEGNLALKKAGVPVVEIDLKQSLPPKFLVVEKINIQLTLKELMEGRKASGEPLKLDKKQIKQLKQALLEFALKTWRFKRIGDFRGNQIGWDGIRWVLFDMDNRHSMIQSFANKRTAFTTFSVEDFDFGGVNTYSIVDSKFEKQIDAAIIKEREKQEAKLEHAWFRREQRAYKPLRLVDQAMPFDDLIGADLRVVDMPYFDFKSFGLSQNILMVTIGKIVNQDANFIVYEVELSSGPQNFIGERFQKRPIGSGLILISKNKKRMSYKAEKDLPSRNLRFYGMGDDFKLYGP